MNDENLNPFTKENAKEMQLKSAEKRKENNAKKKLMSQIYAEFLEKEYNVKTAEGTKKISGAELCNEAMNLFISVEIFNQENDEVERFIIHDLLFIFFFLYLTYVSLF